MPLERISSCALRNRCIRSAAEMGGGIGIDGVSTAACAMTRSSGRVIAAASAPVPPRNVRRFIEE